MTPDPYAHPAMPSRATGFAAGLFLVAVIIVGVNLAIVLSGAMDGKTDAAGLWALLFTLFAVVQMVAGLVAGILFVVAIRRRPPGAPMSLLALAGSVAGFLLSLGGPVGWVLGIFVEVAKSGIMLGGAWGRPLRVRGRQLHPELREGADWTRGARPDGAGLDAGTRRALEALWLHDAQKEHASVPAFARISWLLAAVGAPASLAEWAHRAAMEEIDHTRRCFALAAGYGGRSHTVEPMPDLLLGALEAGADPLATLATESLSDGCQLEDFNADVAAECAAGCREPVTRAVLEQIAREERSHADFSWALLEWLVDAHGPRVRDPIAAGLAALDRYPRPTAASERTAPLVGRADPATLRAHGRIPDGRWAALWDERLTATRVRAGKLLPAPPAGRVRTGPREDSTKERFTVY